MSAWKVPVDRFQGCLVGALIGDCLGAPFEGMAFSGGIPQERIMLVISPERLKTKKNWKGTKQFTDDTAMLRSVCGSLIQCKGFDSVDMATRFTKEYFRDMNRGYGGGVLQVFNTWANSGINYKNVFTPSVNQFDGKGSYGNGGAMRVAPVALRASSSDDCVSMARESARLTHSHRSGYNGAVLQSLAVYKSLNSEGSIKWQEFLRELIEDMVKIECITDDAATTAECEIYGDTELSDIDKLYEWTRSDAFSYTKHLRTVDRLLTQHYKNKSTEDTDIDDTEQVINHIGRDITAAQAVPAAIYCFLRNLDASVEETLYYTLSLGGDTDTVATMCMAMVGAHRGYVALPEVWTNVCESHEEAKEFAEKLYDMRTAEK